MRILYFAPHPIGPLTAGGRLRDYHLALALAREAQVTFLEIRNGSSEESDWPNEKPFAQILSLQRTRGYTPWKIARGLLGPHSLTALNYGSAPLRSQLRAALGGLAFDSIQMENVHLLSYVPVLRSLFPHTPILADWHNIESELMGRYADGTRHPARKLMAWRTARLLAREEERLLSACDVHTVTSKREQHLLRQRCPDKPIEVVPNGVAIRDYPADNLPNRQVPAKRLLFVGSMDYHANVNAVLWFIRDVWPNITQLHPDLHFTVVGRNPPQIINRLAGPQITVTGEVNKTAPFYRAADIVVVPLRVGSGTRLKILEAMAAGVPVISTALGAEGLNLEAGRHFLETNDAGSMVQAIDQLWKNRELGQRLAAAARAYVTEHYDWPLIGRSLYKIHQSLAARAMSGAT